MVGGVAWGGWVGRGWPGIVREDRRSTGCFKANFYTLTGDYDKYTVCTEKIVVDFFSVHMEILFDGNRSEKNNCLYSKNLNWKFRPFFP